MNIGYTVLEIGRVTDVIVVFAISLLYQAV